MFLANSAYLGGAFYVQHSAGEVFFQNLSFVKNYVQSILLPTGTYGNDAVGAAIAWNCYSISIIRSHNNTFLNNRGKTGVVGGICGIFIDLNSTFSGYFLIMIMIYLILGSNTQSTSTLYIQGFSVVNISGTIFNNESSLTDSTCFFSIYTFIYMRNITFTVF